MSAGDLQIDTSTAGIAFERGGTSRATTPFDGSASLRRGCLDDNGDGRIIVGLDAAGSDLDKFIRAHTPGRTAIRDVDGNNYSKDNVFDDLSTLTSGDINSVRNDGRRLPKINTSIRGATKYDSMNGARSPFAEDQTTIMRNFNTSYKDEKEKKDVSAMFTRAVSNLPQEKATILLHALAELETTLRLEGVARLDEYGEKIKYDYGIGVADENHSPTSIGVSDMMSVAGSSTVSLSSSASSLFGSESVMSRYSVDKKYGRTTGSDAKQVHTVLKKIGKAVSKAAIHSSCSLLRN